MQPPIHHEFMNARVADFHRQAERDRIAVAALQARRARPDGKRPPVGRPARVLARGLRLLLANRSA